ncbi:biotin transporter BioY [Oceanivirga salmonicida]|uniref:biotin transporter BioY n=1 Tax=Oceanivirga salmonicida TaxID=1769291 RepID=UPI00082D1C2F|nr:biotin transporter BioY [Oceanivirga salmonicida]
MNKNILMNNIWISEENLIKRNTVLVFGAFLFLSLMSQIKIFLPFTPVPITGQTLAVILIGLSFNRYQSAIIIITYILAGELGLPVFAGFKTGLLFSPSGGYIIGFLFSTQVAAYLSEKGWTKSTIKLILSFIIANAVIYIAGLAQLSAYVPEGKLLATGLYPFILGDILKLFIAFGLIKQVWRIVK